MNSDSSVIGFELPGSLLNSVVQCGIPDNSRISLQSGKVGCVGFCELTLCTGIISEREQSIGNVKQTLLELIIPVDSDVSPQNRAEISTRNQIIGKVLLSKSELPTISNHSPAVRILVSRLTHRSDSIVVSLISLSITIDRHPLGVCSTLRTESTDDSRIVTNNTRLHESPSLSPGHLLHIFSERLSVEFQSVVKPCGCCTSHLNNLYKFSFADKLQDSFPNFHWGPRFWSEIYRVYRYEVLSG